jgi:hypothetical protein
VTHPAAIGASRAAVLVKEVVMWLRHKTGARCALLVAVLAASAFGTALADAPPQPVRQGDVTYVSGGIGWDEQEALKATAKDYNLIISNADKAGEYTSNVDLRISGKGGQDVLHVAGTGPLFYAKLPPGTYRIAATLQGAERVRDVTVGADRATDIHFIWP